VKNSFLVHTTIVLYLSYVDLGVSWDLMKTLIFISALFFSTHVIGQSPYARLTGEFRSLFDPIPIDKGQEKQFFDYAMALYQCDSLKKAGQLFDRVYWLDTTSSLGKQSLLFRSQIEEKAKKQARENLNSVWTWDWSGTNWGATDSPSKSKKIKRIELDGTTIKFYHNDILVRQTEYTLTQTFTWIGGYLTNHIKYGDNKEEWYFHLTSMYDFTSDRLWIEQKSKYLCGNYGESYLLDKEKQQLTGRMYQSW
jgi:hypothetical protein